MPRTTWLVLALLVAGRAAGAAPLAESERHLVFAHYMVCFGSTVEFYKQEIELAQRHGIDGFALNCGGWGSVDAKTGEFQPGPYVRSAERIYEAARQLDSGFRLFLSADVAGLGNLPANIGDMVKRFADHPNQFRAGGKVVLSAWAGTPATYSPALAALKAEGRDVFFVPFVTNRKFPMAWSTETLLRLFDGQPHMDGLFYFACDGTAGDIVRQNAAGRRVTQFLDKVFMAGAAPAYNSPNLRDFRGMEGYGAVWEGIIRDDADWVELVTWNDYNEDSNLMPYRWGGGMEREYYDRDEAYLDATAYYSAWYKSGRQPAVTQDKAYLCYRNRSKWQRKAWDPQKKAWVDLTMNEGRFDQIHDDVGDFVYVTTFLTAPAELTVRVGKQARTFRQPAGIGHAAVPLAPGVPRVILQRGGAALLDFVGRKLIVGEPTPENSVVGYHLANRTWMGGAAAGPALRLEAESGAIAADAVVERGAVRNAEVEQCGFALPLHDVQTGTYNIRVRYSNPSGREARLTLLSDGPPRAEKDYPYFIPLFLPPTAKGEFVDTSLFWSLYQGATHLSVQWMPGHQWGKPLPEGNDFGSVLIDRIDLVKVEPVVPLPAVPTATPELVPIPGGSFRMGSTQGEPDEHPVHEVALSPFAIGRYEVTNEEFERFDPGHREFRDGYSWRSREPVIYVSWVEAARYCNWLSRQNGLVPVYHEQTWAVDPGADGFRLPTEAEWEYVASGRGEGRPYPWGRELPDGTRGNIAGAVPAAWLLPSTPGGGTTVVGSFPAGASRDGVLDLAGNAAEWCSDWYQPYGPEARTDPCCRTPSHYRVIRGGSWGYYGHSQRAADRELNSAGYGGYIYIGFRVAIGEAGWKKLQASR